MQNTVNMISTGRALFLGVVLLLAGCTTEYIEPERLPVDLRNKVSVEEINILFREPDEPDDLYLAEDEDLRSRLDAALSQRVGRFNGDTPVTLQLVVRKHVQEPIGEYYLRAGWYHLSVGLKILHASSGETLARYEVIEEYGVPVFLAPFLANTDHDAELTNGMAEAIAHLLRVG